MPETVEAAAQTATSEIKRMVALTQVAAGNRVIRNEDSTLEQKMAYLYAVVKSYGLVGAKCYTARGVQIDDGKDYSSSISFQAGSEGKT